MTVFLKIGEHSHCGVLSSGYPDPEEVKRDGNGCFEPRILERIGVLLVMGPVW